MTKFELVKQRLISVPFAGQYYDEPQTKKSITLHHTAGGSADSSIAGWRNDPVKVGTCVVIDRDGTIFQCFPSDRWAFSLGLNTSNYKAIEKQTIGIEIANYGYLNKSKGDFYNAYKSYISPEKVCTLDKPFKGQLYYENYTDQQIESVKRLLELWNERYGISIKYNPSMFELSSEAINGASGLFSHNSYRADKSDIYPHPKMIEMLKTL